MHSGLTQRREEAKTQRKKEKTNKSEVGRALLHKYDCVASSWLNSFIIFTVGSLRSPTANICRRYATIYRFAISSTAFELLPRSGFLATKRFQRWNIIHYLKSI